ncbi:MAG: hypothetical protein A2V70_06015 [Planctomycetes bacterium RBG_13_63_9]|nr:MAG: hypothetical protein A2V70_06015 [Planctomycetes bacterium RBG_13_63_9]
MPAPDHGSRRLVNPRGTGQILAWATMVLASAVSAPPAMSAPPEAAAADPVDLRPIFQQGGLPARAQGGRNTCSVFTVVGAIEYALAERQPQGRRLSIEFLNWASNRTIHQSQDGAYFSDLWKGFETYGICAEDEMPYQAEFDRTLRPSPTARERAGQARDAGLRLHWIKRWNPQTGLTEQEFAEIKQTLRRKWPVCGGFRWPKQERWNDGVLEMAPPEGVRDGHSILLVGYRDEAAQPGGGGFLIRNSGKGLRDAAMTYEYVRTYMNDAVWIDRAGPAVAAPSEGAASDDAAGPPAIGD